MLFCILLSAGFSLDVNALQVNISPYHVYVIPSAYNNDTGALIDYGVGLSFYANDGLSDYRVCRIPVIGIKSVKLYWDYTFATDDKTAFIKKGKTGTITIENISQSIATCVGDTCSKAYYNTNGVTGYVTYTDGTTKAVSPTYTNKSNNFIDVSFTVTAEKDIAKFNITTSFLSGMGDTNYTKDLTIGIGELLTEDNDSGAYAITVDVEEESTGLLKGIGDKLTSGFKGMVDGITNVASKLTSGFSELGSKISGVVDSIVQLPSKLWKLIEDGLKGLFIPNEQYMITYKDDWSNLMSEKLGAVWQVSEITFGAWEKVGECDEQNTVAFPKVTIPLPDNNDFSFGGYDVQIVPTGFEFLATAVKTIVGVVSTLAFINGIRKRYDEIMGVER